VGARVGMEMRGVAGELWSRGSFEEG
jgi:hypothetical protein